MDSNRPLSFFEKATIVSAVLMAWQAMIPEQAPANGFAWFRLCIGLAAVGALAISRSATAPRSGEPGVPPAVPALFILAFLAGLYGCVPKFDPGKVQGLQDVRATPARCVDLLAAEQAKCDSGSPTCDKKSIRHVAELCACYTNAGTVAERRHACDLNVDAYVAYEHAKVRK